MPATKPAKTVTIDDVWAIIAKLGDSQKKAHEETEKELRESIRAARAENAETAKVLREAHAKTEKALEDAIRSAREANAETERTLREVNAETERTLRQLHAETEKTLNKAIGGLSNTMGALVEKTMTAGLPQKFKEFGFNFDHLSFATWADGENNIFTQIDGLVENGTQAIAVEVKTTLQKEDVDDHLIRMEKVRKYANLHGDTREFFAAIAATILDKSVKAYALKKGFFVIEPSGEDVKITKPVSAKVW